MGFIEIQLDPNALKCSICYVDYDFSKTRACVGTCGHAVCEVCKTKMSSKDCPRCFRPDAFRLTTINFALTELLRNLANTKHFENLQKVLATAQCGTSENSHRFPLVDRDDMTIETEENVQMFSSKRKNQPINLVNAKRPRSGEFQ